MRYLSPCSLQNFARILQPNLFLRTLLALGIALPVAVTALTLRPAGGQTTTDTIVTSKGVQINDPEYDQETNRVVWVSKERQIWVANIDPATGDWSPRTGRGTQVAADSELVPEEVGNGPEWVQTSSGPQIVYTRQATGAEPRGLAKATQDPTTGAWTVTIPRLAGNRYAPIGSQDPGDPEPRISYLQDNLDTVTKWRFLDQSTSEEKLPGKDVRGLRWVRGDYAITYSAIDETTNIRQAYYYNVKTKVLEKLTSDPAKKESVFMFQAPELNNETVFFTLLSETKIGIYRKKNGLWSPYYVIDPPATGTYIQSPEPFVYNGKTYISYATSDSPSSTDNQTPTDIWVSNIDPKAPFNRQCSDTTVKVRKDPESYITTSGPVIFYTAKPDPQTPAVVYRCNPGIPQ